MYGIAINPLDTTVHQACGLPTDKRTGGCWQSVGDTGHREVYSAASDPVFIEATSLWSVSPSGSHQPPSS